MTIYITARHMSPPTANDHEHIASVQWQNAGSPTATVTTREQMIEWINGGGEARVSDGQGSVRVGVVKANPPYLRTYADDRWTDNLLSLPNF